MIVQASGDLNFQEVAGLPCAHAMAAMGYARHEVQEYVLMCFSKQAYLSTYLLMFNHIPDQCTWGPTGRQLIDPSIVQRKIGRPKKCITNNKSATECFRAENEKEKTCAFPIFYLLCITCEIRYSFTTCFPGISITSIASGQLATSSQPTTASSQTLRSSQPATSSQPIRSGPGETFEARTKKRKAGSSGGHAGTRGRTTSA
ncbi:hypothetical protein WN943_023665 [Citrus x changshan-huyou]